MKSLAELEQIRKATLEKINLRREDKADLTRVVIGMATCGIAAGARPVMRAFMDEIDKRNLQHVTISQTGCIGICKYEPVVEIYEPGGKKTTYVHMTPEKAEEVVTRHLSGGTPVKEYVIPASITAPQ